MTTKKLQWLTCAAILLGMCIAVLGVSNMLRHLILFPATIWDEELSSHFTHEETKTQKSKWLAQIDKAGGEAKSQTQLFLIPKPLCILSWTSPAEATKVTMTVWGEDSVECEGPALPT